MQPDYNTFDPNASQLTDRQKRNRKILIAAAVAVILFFIAATIISNIASQKTVTLKPANGITMTFGTASHEEEDAGIVEEIVKTSSEEKTVRVKTGTYAVLYSGDGIKQTRELIELVEDTTITPPKPRYTDERLTSMLQKERPTIETALRANSKTATYSTEGDQLYQDGTWFAARLVPANRQTQDALVVIMQKVNDTWKVAAQPDITLYIGDYPKIPADIIRDINNRTY